MKIFRSGYEFMLNLSWDEYNQLLEILEDLDKEKTYEGDDLKWFIKFVTKQMNNELKNIKDSEYEGIT